MAVEHLWLLFFLITFIVTKKTDLRGFIPLNWISPKLVVVWNHSEVLFKTQNMLVIQCTRLYAHMWHCLATSLNPNLKPLNHADMSFETHLTGCS